MRKYSLTVSYRLRFSTVNPRGHRGSRRLQALIVMAPSDGLPGRRGRLEPASSELSGCTRGRDGMAGQRRPRQPAIARSARTGGMIQRAARRTAFQAGARPASWRRPTSPRVDDPAVARCPPPDPTTTRRSRRLRGPDRGPLASRCRTAHLTRRGGATRMASSAARAAARRTGVWPPSRVRNRALAPRTAPTPDVSSVANVPLDLLQPHPRRRR